MAIEIGRPNLVPTESGYLRWDENNFASNLYNLRTGCYYIIPKMKFLFFIEFIVRPQARHWLNIPQTMERLPFMAKMVDRPTINYELQELNQYNRKRIVTTGITYGSSTIVFQDTVDDVALKLFKDYSEYYYHDFNNEPSAWNYDLINAVDHTNNAGYKPRQRGSDLYFFESINVYEFYNGHYTMYKMMNPRFEQVNFSPTDMEDGTGTQEITISIKPEGLVYEEITAMITPEISEKFGLPYQSGSTNNFLPNEELDSKIPGNDIYVTEPYKMPEIIYYEPPGLTYRGDISQNIQPNVMSNIQPTINNFLSNAGMEIAKPVVNSLISTGKQIISEAIDSIF